MPSCTNQIESTHGHLNALTPRNNKFWKSLSRIINEILKKKNRFEDNFRHNYRCYKNKIKSIIKVTPEDVMNSMIEQYEPDLENNKCKCGQAELFSAMINKKLPCIHLYYLEKKFPLVDPPSLNIVDSFYGEMTFEYHIQQSEKIETNSDYYDNIRAYVVKKIKRNSHSQEKDEIIAFVKGHCKRSFIK